MRNKYLGVVLQWIQEDICTTKLLPLLLSAAQLRMLDALLLRYVHKMLRCRVAVLPRC